MADVAPYHRPTAVDKLVTNEDPLHLHKLLGAYVLLHFCVQLGLYACTRTMYLTPMLIWPHIALHASSFAFKVLPKRPAEGRGRMFVWQELRAHAGIFAMRQCMCILYPRDGPLFVISTMAAADAATWFLGTPGLTTVRGCQHKRSKSIAKRAAGAFFSMSQLGGTLICSGAFQPNGVNPVLAFASLPAIQTSPFGMTLLRKNLISKTTWQVVYAAQLVLVYCVWYAEYGSMWLAPVSLALYLLRCTGVSKYVLWPAVILTSSLIPLLGQSISPPNT
tara:strand:+ start:2070 stop:2900 length:831 start_codon:yes stop_codon:yes gene_type:complete